MSSRWISFGIAPRRASQALIALGLLGSFPGFAGADGAATLRRLGPVGLVADQEVVVTVANPTGAPISAAVMLLDATAQVLALEQVTIAAHRSESVSWSAPGDTRVRATVATPGGAVYPTGLFVYDAGAPRPSVATQANSIQAAPPGTTPAAVSPFVPMIAAAKTAVSVVNLNPVSATFTVSFLDGEGTVISVQTLVIAPQHTAVASLSSPLPDGTRAEVQASPGTRYLVSSEIVDEASGKTTAVLLPR